MFRRRRFLKRSLSPTREPLVEIAGPAANRGGPVPLTHAEESNDSAHRRAADWVAEAGAGAREGGELAHAAESADAPNAPAAPDAPEAPLGEQSGAPPAPKPRTRLPTELMVQLFKTLRAARSRSQRKGGPRGWRCNFRDPFACTLVCSEWEQAASLVLWDMVALSTRAPVRKLMECSTASSRRLPDGKERVSIVRVLALDYREDEWLQVSEGEVVSFILQLHNLRAFKGTFHLHGSRTFVDILFAVLACPRVATLWTRLPEPPTPGSDGGLNFLTAVISGIAKLESLRIYTDETADAAHPRHSPLRDLRIRGFERSGSSHFTALLRACPSISSLDVLFTVVHTSFFTLLEGHPPLTSLRIGEDPAERTPVASAPRRFITARGSNLKSLVLQSIPADRWLIASLATCTPRLRTLGLIDCPRPYLSTHRRLTVDELAFLNEVKRGCPHFDWFSLGCKFAWDRETRVAQLFRNLGLKVSRFPDPFGVRLE
ncbi:hypothetical protein BDK51DRAFT_27322, partial [Blyttiomyces helicus]